MLVPVGPAAPEALRPLLKSLHDAVLGLLAPAAPSPLFAVAQAALPPAAAHSQSLVLVTDLNILAHSDGAHWIRQDTGAVIA